MTIGFAYEVGEATVLIQRLSGVPPIASVFQGDRIRFVVLTPDQNQAVKNVDQEDYYRAVIETLEHH